MWLFLAQIYHTCAILPHDNLWPCLSSSPAVPSPCPPSSTAATESRTACPWIGQYRSQCEMCQCTHCYSIALLVYLVVIPMYVPRLSPLTLDLIQPSKVQWESFTTFTSSSCKGGLSHDSRWTWFSMLKAAQYSTKEFYWFSSYTTQKTATYMLSEWLHGGKACST